MKKGVNVDRYEKEIIVMVDTLKEFVRSKNMRMIEDAIDDIVGAIELYKNAIEDELVTPKEEGRILENTGMYMRDLTTFE
tara:strand:- start:87 stop:326 length:240 start_codon:yes stop_codon:yes gene_type:complete